MSVSGIIIIFKMVNNVIVYLKLKSGAGSLRSALANKVAKVIKVAKVSKGAPCAARKLANCLKEFSNCPQ